MNIVIIATFDHFYSNEVAYRLTKRGLSVRAMVLAGWHPDAHSRRVHWNYTAHFEGRHLSDLEPFGIPIYVVSDLHSAAAFRILGDLSSDVFVQAGAGILKPALFEIPNIGVVNCHPGALPEFRGCNAVEWSLLEDAPLCATAHFIDEGIDTGPIICDSILDVGDVRDYNEIRRRMFFHEVDVHVDAVDKIVNGFGVADARPQGKGKYRKLMDELTLRTVVEKVESGRGPLKVVDR